MSKKGTECTYTKGICIDIFLQGLDSSKNNIKKIGREQNHMCLKSIFSSHVKRNLVHLPLIDHLMAHLYMVRVFIRWKMNQTSHLIILNYQKNNNKSRQYLLVSPHLVKYFANFRLKWSKSNSVLMKK